jgi:hypothetical protein
MEWAKLRNSVARRPTGGDIGKFSDTLTAVPTSQGVACISNDDIVQIAMMSLA